MKKITGKIISKGITIGNAFCLTQNEIKIDDLLNHDSKKELEKYEIANSLAIKQLNFLYEKTLKDVGEEMALLFQTHAMMLDDDDLKESIINKIKEGHSAIYSVSESAKEFSDVFANMDDEYFKARSLDILDIGKRVINNIVGNQNKVLEKPSIIFAKELTPSQTAEFNKSYLLGFITQIGSINSHTGILARNLGIPALTGINIDDVKDGDNIILDANLGYIFINPDAKTIKEYEEKIKKEKENKEALKKYIGKSSISPKGKKISLMANISKVEDVEKALENDAEGIGLFRSEFLYLNRANFPSEEEQFNAYKTVLEKMNGKKVVIRTLDIGADKKCDYFNMTQEENPALGCRAIRICLTRPEIFKTQLRALLRASYFGNLAIMYPMITSLKEINKIYEIVNEVKKSLDDEHIPYGKFEQGIMIETPAAAIMSDVLAKYVDFFSIGTNDLTQYTLAIDRQAQNMDMFYDPHSEAVLRLISLACENAHKEGKWCGVCGELGGDGSLTDFFLKINMDELSMSSPKILEIRYNVVNSKKE